MFSICVENFELKILRKLNKNTNEYKLYYYEGEIRVKDCLLY